MFCMIAKQNPSSGEQIYASGEVLCCLSFTRSLSHDNQLHVKISKPLKTLTCLEHQIVTVILFFRLITVVLLWVRKLGIYSEQYLQIQLLPLLSIQWNYWSHLEPTNGLVQDPCEIKPIVFCRSCKHCWLIICMFFIFQDVGHFSQQCMLGRKFTSFIQCLTVKWKLNESAI